MRGKWGVTSIDPVGLMVMRYERFFAKPKGRKIARKAEMVRVTNVMAQL
jgi:hypothetical protein